MSPGPRHHSEPEELPVGLHHLDLDSVHLDTDMIVLLNVWSKATLFRNVHLSHLVEVVLQVVADKDPADHDSGAAGHQLGEADYGVEHLLAHVVRHVGGRVCGPWASHDVLLKQFDQFYQPCTLHYTTHSTLHITPYTVKGVPK